MSSTLRWLIVAMVAFAAMTYAVTGFDYAQYVQSWGGAMFKAMSGGFMGFVFSRFVMKLNISALPFEQRPVAGLSTAILVAAGMIGVSNGV